VTAAAAAFSAAAAEETCVATVASEEGKKSGSRKIVRQSAQAEALCQDVNRTLHLDRRQHETQLSQDDGASAAGVRRKCQYDEYRPKRVRHWLPLKQYTYE